MKKFVNIGIALVLAVCFFGCEKDDICAGTTPTTSRLMIEFYDFNNPAILKSVTNLTAFGNDNANGVVFNEALPVTDSTRYFRTGTSVALPLDVSQNSTKYKLKIFSQSDNPAVFNEDVIKIDYETEQIYVSRACGYKTVFYLDNVLRNPGTTNDPNEWIRNITFDPITIDNENDIHVKIYW